jgi:hypothetical protein
LDAKRIRRGLEKGKWPKCMGKEDVKCILLSCTKSKKMEDAIYE